VRARRAVWILGVVACGMPSPDGSDVLPPLAPNQGVVEMIRLLDGSPGTDAMSFLGEIVRADPDSAGMVYHLTEVPPGRVPLQAQLLGLSTAYAVADVAPDGVSAVLLMPLELNLIPVDDPWAPVTVDGDGFTVVIPGGAAVIDEAEVQEPWTLGWRAVTAADRHGLPADLQVQISDDEVVPMHIVEGLALFGWTGDGRAVSVPDPVMSVVFDLAPDSPLRTADAPVLMRYSHGLTYWVRRGDLTVDLDAGTATLDGFGGLGWLGAGSLQPRGCIAGVVTDAASRPVGGATVSLLQDGIDGVDRVTARDGAFCLSMDPGAAGTLAGLGMTADRGALYTGSASVDGPMGLGSCAEATCASVGALVLETHADADADRYFSGPGGDCDDGDPDINPNLTFGDGRFCGGLP